MEISAYKPKNKLYFSRICVLKNFVYLKTKSRGVIPHSPKRMSTQTDSAVAYNNVDDKLIFLGPNGDAFCMKNQVKRRRFNVCSTLLSCAIFCMALIAVLLGAWFLWSKSSLPCVCEVRGLGIANKGESLKNTISVIQDVSKVFRIFMAVLVRKPMAHTFN